MQDLWGVLLTLKFQNSGSSRHLPARVIPQPSNYLHHGTITREVEFSILHSIPPPAPLKEIWEKGCGRAISKQTLCHSSFLVSWLSSLLSCCIFSPQDKGSPSSCFWRANLSVLPCFALNLFPLLRARLQTGRQVGGNRI